MTRRSAGNERVIPADVSDGLFSRRRTTSGSKLAQLFRSETGEPDEVALLLKGLNDMAITSKLTAKIADTQLRGVETMERWARRSRNCAIDDVMQRTKELFEMYCTKQMQFASDFDHFVQELRKIAESERRVEEYGQEVAKRESKVARLKKQAAASPTSLFRKKNRAEREQLRVERDSAVEELETARRGLRKARAEMEVAKMFHFRRGMMGIADIYRNLALNCGQIFGCQREITELVPPVSTQDVYTMLYEDAPQTRERVDEVRRSLGQEEYPVVYNPPAARRRSENPRRTCGRSFGTPPPPYTPTVRSEPRLPTQRSRFSDPHLTAHRRVHAENFVNLTPTGRPAPRSVAPSAPAASPLHSTALYPDLTQLMTSK